jgi:Right handed beta helix region
MEPKSSINSRGDKKYISAAYMVLLLFLITVSCHNTEKGQVLKVLHPREAIENPKTEFHSLQEAVNASSAYRECTIVLDSVPYYLSETVVIDSTCSGLTIRSETGQRARVYGGTRINNWRSSGKYWVADVLGMDFRIMEMNGRLADRSRVPDSGYFHHVSKFDSRWLSTVQGGFDPKPTLNQLLSMKYKPGDLDSIEDLDNAEITLYHSWDETLVRIASDNKNAAELSFTQAPAYPAGAFGISKYVVWNSSSGMTRPGQWYLDRKAGELYYYPLPGEQMEEAECVLPVVKELLHIQNASNIRIAGIEFRSNHSSLRVGGFGAKWFTGALYAENSDSLTFENLSLCNLSTNAIKGISCDHVRITDCHMHHVGAAAIRLIGTGNTIHNNLVHDVGLVYPSTIAIYINVTDPNASEEWELGKDEGNVVISHNKVYNAPYVGICCGGHDSEIRANHVSRVVQELTDGGGIYVTFCNNLILADNFISDIQNQEGAGTCAYYLDELTNNALVENNLSLNVHRPLHTHLCSNNVARNNIFIVEKGDASMTFPRCRDFVIERNILCAGKKVRIAGMNALTGGQNNILYSARGASMIGSDMFSYEETNPRPIQRNEMFRITDPELVNYKNGQVKFDPGSPAIELLIREIDVSGAGPSNHK